MKREDELTIAQQELLDWIRKYIEEFNYSPSIRQMMKAMGLKSPAPIQSRLKHLHDKGKILWQEGKARTFQLVEEKIKGIPLLGTVAAGGLIESFDDCNDVLDINSTLDKKGVFALLVNGDSMIDAHIADGDTVLLEPVHSLYQLRNGDIVSAMVPGEGTTLKYFQKKQDKIFLEAANPKYSPIILDQDQLSIQGKLVAVWRKSF